MKVKIIISVALILGAKLMFGQASWLNGGGLNSGAGPGGGTIGTNNNFPMQFFTNNIQRMFIKDNNINIAGGNNRGYLGVGDPALTAPPLVLV